MQSLVIWRVAIEGIISKCRAYRNLKRQNNFVLAAALIGEVWYRGLKEECLEAYIKSEVNNK